MTYNFDTGDGRIDAIVRLLLLIYVFTIYPFVIAIGLIAGLFWMVIDVLGQLWHGDQRYTLFNRDGFILGGLLAGPSGVGKTTLARHTLDRVTDEVGGHVTYIRCLGLSAREVLTLALRDHPEGAVPQDDTMGLAEHRGRLREATATGQDHFLILDEADRLPQTTLLDAVVDLAAVSLVVCVHDADAWLAQLDRDQERALRETIHLDRFGVDELADILDRRAQRGLRPHAVRRPVLAEIADVAAGVARVGIQTLRAAAELAHEREARQISADLVPAAHDRAESWIRKHNLRSLLFHHHVLYALLYRAGSMTPRDLYDRYDEIAKEVYASRRQTPISERERRTKLRKLRDYGLIERVGPDRYGEYRVVDEAIAPPIELPMQREQ